MSGKSIFRSSALYALAVAMTATAIPSTAFAQQPQREERGGGWQRGGESRGGGENRGGGNWRGGGDFRNQQVQRPQTPQVQRPSAPQVQRPAWGGSNPQAQARPEQARPDQSRPAWRGRTEGSQRDWGRSQGRDWQSGTVNRPAPAQNAGRPAVPERGWDGRQWNGTNPGNQNAGRDWNRDRDRDGRDLNRDRDGRNWSRDRDGRTWNRDGRDWNRDNWRRDDRRSDNWRNSYRGDYRRWSNDWRRDNRYNWNHYRSVNRGIYRMPRYYSPYRGYNYSRLSIGIFLNSGFYGQNYWINDPWAYRLPPAYGPYRWVRYWDDVLLVDVYSGEVVDVIHDFFW